MLADLSIVSQAGRLRQDVHLPGTARYALLDFIAKELPHWRDHPDRKLETSERILTDQLCSHLNSAARMSTGWSRIQFSIEFPDETKRGRSIDLVSKPCGVTLIVEGRRHTQFNSLLPIECKRLPTPQGKDRDEREYVTTNPGQTGGIQRFKLGLHGAAHQVGAMIAYVQEMPFSYWLDKINGWIRELAADTNSGWTNSDRLQDFKEDPAVDVGRSNSYHRREKGLAEFELKHLWIRMN